MPVLSLSRGKQVAFITDRPSPNDTVIKKEYLIFGNPAEIQGYNIEDVKRGDYTVINQTDHMIVVHNVVYVNGQRDKNKSQIIGALGPDDGIILPQQPNWFREISETLTIHTRSGDHPVDGEQIYLTSPDISYCTVEQ